MVFPLKFNFQKPEDTFMNERVKKAFENRKKGYNCCQAVVCAYSDIFDVDEETVFKVAEGFGSGFGGMQGICGAISGAVIIAGLKNSAGTKNTKTKINTYKISKEVIEKFQNKNSSVICKELKGIETKKVLRSCEGCIEDAVKLIDEIVLK